jgi:DNA polymerase III epsilon subunit family exonuclease
MAASELMGLTFSAAQRRAVAAPLGPILVLAGPGAGKTRCLTGRIAFLLHSGVEPHRICALTFTNKAAQEIAERLRHGLGEVVEQMTLGTIHALCLRMLRRHGHGVGLPAGFGVADEEHQRLVLGRLGVSTRRHRSLLTQFGRRRQDHSLSEPDETLFWTYNRQLRSNHLIDFDEILSLTHKLLESSVAARTAWQATWDHLLIDEFQDLDKTQYAILRSLAQEHRSLFAVGDDEQSIFSWRGAAPRLMKHFIEDFAIDAPIILDANHRCSTAIFETARRILPIAEPLFVKNIAALRESSYPVRAAGCADEIEETAWVVSDLQADLRASGLCRGEYAILYRTHQIGQLFEEALLRAGIPCQLAKGQSLSDDPIIAELLASLRIVADPEADLHVEYLAGKVLPESLLLDVRRQPGATLLDKLRVHAEQAAGADAARAWRFLYQVENLKALRQFHGDLPALIDAIFAQGIGQLDSPLEKCQGLLSAPECLPGARALAEQLLDAAAHGGRVLLPPTGGLEIPLKAMILRVLPQLNIEYLKSAQSMFAEDMTLSLNPQSDRLRIVEIFKSLQALEGRRYRKGFADYVAFDTETTGLDIEHCEVIELAAVKVRDGRGIDTFHSLVRATRPISPGANAVHGYTDADLRNQPRLCEVWPHFRAFVGDCILVAHNGHRFDIPLLERLTAQWQGTRGLTFFDTLPLARNLFPTASLRLEGLAARFGVAHRPNHHALDDSLCLVQVFEHLQEERLRRLRKTCLANLLDCVALGAAIEDREPTHPEDVAILEAASWRELRRPPDIVDFYSEEAERHSLSCPPLQTLLTRLLGEDGWRGGRGEPTLRDRYPESHARLCRLLAMVQSATLEESIRQLLDRTALSRSDGTGIDKDRVSLLTFHATKGLEFSRVYIAGVEDGQLPGPYALDGNRDEMHEARRLLYVAMTRAKDRLTLTWSKQRRGESTGGTTFLDALGLSCPANGAGNGER